MSISPASELFALVEKWAIVPAGTTPAAARAEGKSWWRTHSHAVALTDEVERQANALAESRPELAYALPVLGDVKRMIFCSGWQLEAKTPQQKRMLPVSTLPALAGLVAALNSASSAGTPEAAELRSAIADVESLIATAAFDDDVRSYLEGLCKHLNEAIERAVVGSDADVRSLAFELFTALGFYASAEDSGKIRDVMNRFAKATARFLAVDVPLAISTNIAATAIIEATAG